MACPHYQGGTRCGFHSEHYVLDDKTIKTLCSKDYDYTNCQIFIEHVYPNSKDTIRGVEAKAHEPNEAEGDPILGRRRVMQEKTKKAIEQPLDEIERCFRDHDNYV